jgi:hypothetical protein
VSTPWPTSIGIADFRIDWNPNKGSTQSQFTLKRQFTTLGGGTADQWTGTITTSKLSRADLLAIFAWAVGVDLGGSFTIADPDYSGPVTALSSVLVNGASQSGNALIVDGLPSSQLCWRAGEWAQIGTQLVMATADLTSSGVNGTMNFKPALRASPADNSAVIFAAPVLTAILTSIPSRVSDVLKMGVFTCSFAEF